MLDALSCPPFEPLHQVELKLLSIKTALLVALASAKRVSEIPRVVGEPDMHAVFNGRVEGFTEA